MVLLGIIIVPDSKIEVDFCTARLQAPKMQKHHQWPAFFSNERRIFKSSLSVEPTCFSSESAKSICAVYTLLANVWQSEEVGRICRQLLSVEINQSDSGWPWHFLWLVASSLLYKANKPWRCLLYAKRCTSILLVTPSSLKWTSLNYLQSAL